MLSAEDVHKVHTWLQAKGAKLACPCCGGKGFAVGGPAAMVPVHGGVAAKSGHIKPFIPVTCQHCHYTLLFAAEGMGLSDLVPPSA
jgi:hypothetical protein